MPSYTELHCHSNYSFQEGASSIEDLVVRANELGHHAMALTDHDNLCGAMEFAHTCRSLNIQAIIGAEITLQGGYHLTIIAETREGYANLCRLLSTSHVFNERRSPELDTQLFASHSKGLIVLSGCRQGEVASLIDKGHVQKAQAIARRYMEWFSSGNYFIELQQNLVHGDTQRNRRLVALARDLGIPTVATNNVHYHMRERHHLQDCLVAIHECKSLENTHRERRANSEFHLKSPQEMSDLFRDTPEAIENTLRIAERCVFDLTRDLGYHFPSYPVPRGYTPQNYMEELCYQAAVRRYGSITHRVHDRLQEEFRLIRKHGLAGFFLMYHDIIQLAREVQVELGLVNSEVPIEKTPPGRGRGSSVAMLVGYLIGLSHIDPLQYNLSLERFLPDEMASVPDIDLDFPRNIREELILRVHQKYGWDHAVLSGMVATYQIKGVVRDLGKALALPPDEVDKLAKRVERSDARALRREMLALPEFRDKVDAPIWRDLIDMAAQQDGFPKYLAQHPGGMIISSTPLIDQVPIQKGAIDGRYLCHWDKDSIDNAGFIKIDFLALGTLSQMQEALQIIHERTGIQIDISRIDFEDEAVYDMLCNGDTIGVFQVESAAQVQTITRIQPRNLVDLAHEVGSVRPGVGVNDGVAMYIRRRQGREPVGYDHPLEKHALERTYGVILFQDQVNHVAMDVAGFSSLEADQLRRAYGRKNNEVLIQTYWEKFREGSAKKGVDKDTSRRIFNKFNGLYMFPESHAVAFGVTAYQMAWLKLYYPLEFYVAIFNQQPMGFYNLETLKEDAKRHAINLLTPDINQSREQCTIKGNAICLGFLSVASVGPVAAKAIVVAREKGRPFRSIADVMRRTGLLQEALCNLVDAGAFDALCPDRRAVRWEIGLRYRRVASQAALSFPIDQDMANLTRQTAWEQMEGEYRTIGMHPASHVMAYLRQRLGTHIATSQNIQEFEEGTDVTVAGLVIRRQRPLAKAVFITLEDEFGHIPLIVWPGVYTNLRHVLAEPIIIVRGTVSRREGTLNIVASHAETLTVSHTTPVVKNWG